MSTLILKDLPIKTRKLYVPPLEELATVLNDGLIGQYAEVNVSVVDCPDLTQEPFTLANKGLNGKPSLVEVGGPSYLLPFPKREKIYDLHQIAEITQTNPAFIIGAGAGPFPFEKTNCEGIYNINIDNGTVDQQSRIVKINKENEAVPIEEILPHHETRFALLANLYVSEGKPGKVLKVHVKKRLASTDYITSIRMILNSHYPGKLVGLGGTFLVKEGIVRQHVMPDFSQVALNTDADLENWLHFFNMTAPLVAVGTLVSMEDVDLDLRVQHFHSFSYHNEGGHYHVDTTPDTVEYIGYFFPGDTIYRVDQPINPHLIGRD